MYQIILIMSEKQAKILSLTFRHNYPNYTIHFTISKDLPLNRLQKERNVTAPSPETIIICDRDAVIQNLKEFCGRPLCGSGDLFPLPVIAYSHEDNMKESLFGPAWLIGSADDLTPPLLHEVSARCRGKAMTIIRTGRCLIRELSNDDLPSLLALQEENKNNPGGCFFPENCTAPDSFLNEYIRHQYAFFGYGLFGIFRRPAGFSCSRQEEVDAELSYGLLARLRHKGYAAEAVEALLEEGSRRWQLKRIAARIREDNRPSLRLAESLKLQIIPEPSQEDS